MTETLKRYQLPLLVVILLLAAFGRILNIDTESLWVDEGFSYWAIRHPNMFDLLARDVHPPVYFVMLRAWAGIAGISELALRYLSVLPSVLSVAAIFHAARELQHQHSRDVSASSSSLVPLLAALLLALADMENYVAQETRMYSWHVLWVLLSMWAFLRWLRTGERRAMLGWFLAALLLAYTQYVGLAALAVQGLFALIFLRERMRLQAVGVLLLVGLLFTPWLLLVVSNQTENVGTGFNVPSTLESLWNFRDEWFTQQWALMLGLALLGLVGLRYHGTSDQPVGIVWRPVAASFLLLAWVLVPVMGAYVLNTQTPILMDYRLTQITPAVALLVAFGLGNLRQPALGFLVAVIVVYGLTINDTPRPRPPWREVGQTVARYALPGDLALAHVTPSGDWQVMYYYERFLPEGVEARSLRQWQLEQFYGSRYEEGLPQLLAEYDHVWLMHWSKDVSAFEFLSAAGFQQTAYLAEDWLGNALGIYRFDRIPAPEDAAGRFENGMILRDLRIDTDSLRLDLLWSADSTLTADYTVSARLLNAGGQLVAQHDAQPLENRRPTSSWAPGEVIYDPHTLQLIDELDSLPPGSYQLSLKVYQWTPEGIIDQTTDTGADALDLGIIEIEASGS